MARPVRAEAAPTASARRISVRLLAPVSLAALLLSLYVIAVWAGRAPALEGLGSLAPKDGPLDGGVGGVTLSAQRPGQQVTIGSTYLSNLGAERATLVSATLVPGEAAPQPAAGILAAGPSRVAVMGNAGPLSVPGGLPAGVTWRPASGMVIEGSRSPGTTELIYTITIGTQPHQVIRGLRLVYDVGLRRYTEDVTAVVSICTTAWQGQCPDEAP